MKTFRERDQMHTSFSPSMSKLERVFSFTHRWVGDPKYSVPERKIDGDRLIHGNRITIEYLIGLKRYTVSAFDGYANYIIYLSHRKDGFCDALVVESYAGGYGHCALLKSEHLIGRRKDEPEFVRAWLNRMPVGLREEVAAIGLERESSVFRKAVAGIDKPSFIPDPPYGEEGEMADFFGPDRPDRQDGPYRL